MDVILNFEVKTKWKNKLQAAVPPITTKGHTQKDF